jgi:hypothetical protein
LHTLLNWLQSVVRDFKYRKTFNFSHFSVQPKNKLFFENTATVLIF